MTVNPFGLGLLRVGRLYHGFDLTALFVFNICLLSG